jgi:NAD(P)-dependent dehydrogenase (short-subunit alcohol dehydrogenase family)
MALGAPANFAWILRAHSRSSLRAGGDSEGDVERHSCGYADRRQAPERPPGAPCPKRRAGAGVRLVAFNHYANNAFADSARPSLSSATPRTRWAASRSSASAPCAVRRLNDLGLLVDISQSSRKARARMLAISRSPVIASHSGLTVQVDLERNLSDAELAAVAARGGLVQIVAFSAYLKPLAPDDVTAIGMVARRFGPAPPPDTAEAFSLADPATADWSDQRLLDYRAAQHEILDRTSLAPLALYVDASIVNTASIAGLGGDYGHWAYSAMKAGVINLTRIVAIEEAVHGLRVNSVCSGAVDTPLLQAGLRQVPAYGETALRVIPMARFGRPEELADTVLFLASDLASYVTGAVLVADGGLTAANGMPRPPILAAGRASPAARQSGANTARFGEPHRRNSAVASPGRVYPIELQAPGQPLAVGFTPRLGVERLGAMIARHDCPMNPACADPMSLGDERRDERGADPPAPRLFDDEQLLEDQGGSQVERPGNHIVNRHSEQAAGPVVGHQRAETGRWTKPGFDNRGLGDGEGLDVIFKHRQAPHQIDELRHVALMEAPDRGRGKEGGTRPRRRFHDGALDWWRASAAKARRSS